MALPRRKKLLAIDYGSSVGKLPPQAVDLEEAVLGGMLLEKEAVEAVVAILQPESFYNEQNMKVFAVIQDLYKKNLPADILTVTNELKTRGELDGVGGAYYVSSLTNRVASSANIERHARIVQQKFLARELIRINTNMISRAYGEGEDVFELYSEQEMAVADALGGARNVDVDSIGKLQSQFIDESLHAAETGAPSGVPTGFRGIDKLTNGWQKGNLIIVAARPSMGKSALAIHCAYKAAVEHNVPTAFFSLEVPKLGVVARINASKSQLDASCVAKKQQNTDTVRQMAADNMDLFAAPMYIDDTAALSVLEFRAKIRRLVAKYGVQQAYIDYLQLMTAGVEGMLREQEVAYISRNLKQIAKELNIPIIALAQLSRATENRAGGSKKPQLSDIRESGAIEQDADMIIFPFRPEYYDMEVYENNGTEYPAKGLMSLVVAKHRDGPLGEILMGWIDTYAKVTNYNMLDKCPEHEPINTIENRKSADLDIQKNSSTFVQAGKEAGSEADKTALATNTGFLQQKSPGPEPLPF